MAKLFCSVSVSGCDTSVIEAWGQSLPLSLPYQLAAGVIWVSGSRIGLELPKGVDLKP